MRNFVQRGDTLTLYAPYALASGEPFSVGAIFGVASAAAASGAAVEAFRVGVFQLPKTTGQTWTSGARLYWDSVTKKLTTTATGNLFVGASIFAVASGDATAPVLLAGHVAPVPS